jgi:serine/threonine-protein kinase HipA
VLPVFYENELVGHVGKERVGLSFAYEPSWAGAAGRFAISLSMPLRAEPYPAEIATPWFANLLPEDRQLERIGRLLGRDRGDVYGLLEDIGRDTAGALSIGGPEPIDHAEYRELDEASLADAIGRLPERPMLAGEEGITMSLAGAQTKLAVAVFNGRIHLPMRGAASTHILKPESERLYATVENELLCMRLAARVGLRVAGTSMGVAGGRRYLLVERYDRKTLDGKRVARLHQEDFCQALGIYPTEKYAASGGPGLADIFRTVDRQTARPAGDRLALLDQVIFACCIGDTDRHGKNYSLLLSHGAQRLAPGYDFLTPLAYEGITSNLTMKVGGGNRARYLERRHWERLAKEVHLAPAATVRRAEELSRAIAEAVDGVAAELRSALPVDPAAIQLFSERIRDLATTVAKNSRRGEADDGAEPGDDQADIPHHEDA